MMLRSRVQSSRLGTDWELEGGVSCSSTMVKPSRESWRVCPADNVVRSRHVQGQVTGRRLCLVDAIVWRELSKS